MKVHKSSVPSPRLFEKLKRYEFLFTNNLSEFFQTKEYGKDVKEIHYLEILVPDEIKGDSTPKMVYTEEKKKISCIIQPIYRKATSISISKYGSLIASYYLEMSQQFSELKLKDFNCEKYVDDLEVFFASANLV